MTHDHGTYDYYSEAERNHRKAQRRHLVSMLLDAFSLGMLTGAWLAGRFRREEEL